MTIPPWIDPEAWQAFADMRLAIKKPLTDRGAARILKRLQAIHNAGQDANEALDQSSDMRWQDVYPVKGLDIAVASDQDYRKTKARLDAESRRKGSAPPDAVVRMFRRSA